MTRSLKTIICFLLPVVFIAGSYGQESPKENRIENNLKREIAFIAADTLPAETPNGVSYDDTTHAEASGEEEAIVNPAGAGSIVPGLSLRNVPKQKRFSFGLTLLLGTNHYHYQSGEVTGKSAFAFGAGFYGQLNMGFFAIRPEVLYERNQAQYPGGVVRPNALTVPLNLVLQVPESHPFGGYISVGAYYRYTFSAKQGDREINFNEYFRNEGGISWGLGLRYGDVTVGVTKRYGLTDLLRKKPKEPALRNRSIQFTLSYRF